MKISDEVLQQFKEELEKAKTYQDLMGTDGAIKKLIKNAIEGMLDSELTDELG